MVKAVSGDIVASQTLTSDPKEARGLCRTALDAGHEGIMVKSPASPYLPGKRTDYWLKFKAAVETLDLVVVGATWGHGRRARFISSYRLACLDKETGRFMEVGRVATGITDKGLADLTEQFKPLITAQRGMEVEIEPSIVFEVAYGEIQKSPNYSSGYALRFPRLVAVRSDKSPEEADTLERVKSLYDMQRAGQPEKA